MSKATQAEKIGNPDFGLIRLPRKDGSFDGGQINKVTDACFEIGGACFDASHSYDGAESIIDCIGCRHCMDDCPLDLRIPDLISLYNDYTVHKTVTNPGDRYRWLTRDTGKACDCAGCRVCEGSCGNNVRIADTVKKIAALFDN